MITHQLLFPFVKYQYVPIEWLHISCCFLSWNTSMCQYNDYTSVVVSFREIPVCVNRMITHQLLFPFVKYQYVSIELLHISCCFFNSHLELITVFVFIFSSPSDIHCTRNIPLNYLAIFMIACLPHHDRCYLMLHMGAVVV